MIAEVFRAWWQPDSVRSVAVADIEQSVLDHLNRQKIRLPAIVIVIAAIIAVLAAQTVSFVWPFLWFLTVAVSQIYRARKIARLSQDTTRPSAERLGDCMGLFLLTSAAFSLAALFFPYADESFRHVLSILVVGLIVGSIATLQGYPPAFFAFAIPNGFGVSIGWLISTPQHSPYWVHIVMVLMLLLLLGYLLAFSRDTYIAYATGLNIKAKLQAELSKAQRINDARSKIFAAASHDLRQPLQSISLLAYKLSDGAIPDRERKSVVDTIGVCVDLLSEELDMLLDISDLESDMSANNPESVDVGRLIDNLADLYAPVAIAKDVTLTVNKNQSPVVWADRVLLVRLLRNLIDNALKYTSQGAVTITIAVENNNAFIDFEDTGQGISVQDQALIFDEFYQSGNPERDRSKGLGLGLSVVNRIVGLIGGQLSLDSTLNVGSRFRLQLPASEECSGVQQSLEPHAPDAGIAVNECRFLSGKSVLLIEDHKLVQQATKALLESAGAEVALALDWSDVEKLLDTAMPDLLVSDLRLPNESGVDIANRLREKNQNLPVVLVSGDMSSELAAEAQRSGYVVLGKPVNVSVLLGEIESLFS